MKMTYAAGSPFARKLRIVAMELGLMDRIELVPATVVPGQPDEAYMRDVNPLKKLPALILDDGSVLIDSFVIAEYLDELGGGRLLPASGAARWHARSDHSCLQGMLDSMLLCRYERMVRPEALRWDAWQTDHWGRAWAGMGRFEARDDVLSRPHRPATPGHGADRARLRHRLRGLPVPRQRVAGALPQARRVPRRHVEAPVDQRHRAAAGLSRGRRAGSRTPCGHPCHPGAR